MKKISILILCSFAVLSIAAFAQDKPRAAAQLLKEGESPDVFQLDPAPFDPATEPDADLFISHYSDSDMTVTQGCLKQWQITYPLAGGDPLFPEKKGHYATSIEGLYYAVLEPGFKTDSEKLAGTQKILYIAFGKGVIESGGKKEPFDQDAMILVPENAGYTIENTGNRKLVMYVIVEPVPDGFKPRKDVLVVPIADAPFSANGGGHWSHGTRSGVLRQQDGLATITGMTPVWYFPMTLGQPHSHMPGVEEIWFVVEGDFHLLMGKQFYNLPPGTVYKIPPTGYYPHSNMNLGDKPLRTFWLMDNRPSKGDYKYGDLHLGPPGPDEANPDMYISSYMEHEFRTVHSFVERDMLSKNNIKGARPVERGNVLNYIERFTHASVVAHQKTKPITLKNTQEIYYIVSGRATISGGGKTYDLYPGTCALVPAGLEFVIANGNDDILEMYLVSEHVPDGFTPNREILVRDENAVNVLHNSHWTYDAHVLFGPEDGLAQLGYAAMVEIPPVSFAQPHSHGPEVEEIWATVDSGLEFMLGKHVRKIEQGYCYMVPPDGKAFHANYNTTGKSVRSFYFGLYDGK